jgi:hypothetical protein
VAANARIAPSTTSQALGLRDLVEAVEQEHPAFFKEASLKVRKIGALSPPSRLAD